MGKSDGAKAPSAKLCPVIQEGVILRYLWRKGPRENDLSQASEYAWEVVGPRLMRPRPDRGTEVPYRPPQPLPQQAATLPPRVEKATLMLISQERVTIA